MTGDQSSEEPKPGTLGPVVMKDNGEWVVLSPPGKTRKNKGGGKKPKPDLQVSVNQAPGAQEEPSSEEPLPPGEQPLLGITFRELKEQHEAAQAGSAQEE